MNGRTRYAAVLVAGGALLLASSGCGGSDTKFENKPRPPVPTQLTGVITAKGVTVSPDTLPLAPKDPKAAKANVDLPTPIVLTIANETDKSHSIKLIGKTRDNRRIEAQGPAINPGDTAQIQQSLPAGTYRVEAGNPGGAVDPGEEIASATLTVNPNRQTSSGDLLLP
jgi:hypothetical protein